MRLSCYASSSLGIKCSAASQDAKLLRRMGLSTNRGWWGRCYSLLVKLVDNQAMLQVTVLTDITARKSTAEAMHLCDKALAATSEATLITDCSKPDNPIIYCNDGFTKLFGTFLLRSDAYPAVSMYCPFNMTRAS